MFGKYAKQGSYPRNLTLREDIFAKKKISESLNREIKFHETFKIASTAKFAKFSLSIAKLNSANISSLKVIREYCSKPIL